MVLLQLMRHGEDFVVLHELIAFRPLNGVSDGHLQAREAEHATLLHDTLGVLVRVLISRFEVEEDRVRVGRTDEHPIELLRGLHAAVEERVQAAGTTGRHEGSFLLQLLQFQHDLLDFRITHELAGLVDDLLRLVLVQ